MTNSSDAREILRNGLYSQQRDLFDDVGKFSYENSYYSLPRDESDPHGFATRLVSTLLENHRPTGYPKHHECLFFFPEKELCGSLDREVALKVDISEYNEIYAGDYNIAEEMFYKTMQRMEFKNNVSQEWIHTLIKEYWESVSETGRDINRDVEIFIPVNHIPAENIEKTSF